MWRRWLCFPERGPALKKPAGSACRKGRPCRGARGRGTMGGSRRTSRCGKWKRRRKPWPRSEAMAFARQHAGDVPFAPKFTPRPGTAFPDAPAATPRRHSGIPPHGCPWRWRASAGRRPARWHGLQDQSRSRSALHGAPPD